ncbi:MAG: cation-translocating P-type ATPase [Pseudomonadales bacterium]
MEIAAEPLDLGCEADFTYNVSASGDGLRLSLIVPDIRCAACAFSIERALGRVNGVTGCNVNLSDQRVVVDFKNVDVDDITGAIEKSGYTVLPDRTAEIQSSIVAERKALLARLGVAGIGMMQVMMFSLAGYVAGDQGIEPAYESLMRWASLAIATPIAFYSASVFHQGAWRDLVHRSPGMDVPVSLAILVAWSLSVFNTFSGNGAVYFDSVCMFSFFLLIGRYVELRSRQRYQESQNLSDSLLPACARVCGEGEDRLVDMKLIRPGDRVRVLPGERMPVDGFIVHGSTSTNEAAFTGEAAPVNKHAGATVLAGSDNLDGEVQIEAQAGYDEFVITKISDLFRESSAYRPRFSVLADRIARHFVVAILGLAAATAMFWLFAGAENWVAIGLTVLVVSCPCALSLATPVAYTVATSAMRNVGVVISQGAFLERVSLINRVVFDKTGTLTRGRFKVAEIRHLTHAPHQMDSLAVATALERDSKHPLARAFDLMSDIVARDIDVVPGRGVRGYIDGHEYRLGSPDFAWDRSIQVPSESGIWILLAGEEPLAWICLTDEDRPEVPGVMAWLREHGFSISILTGDSSGDGARLANDLGIEQLFSGMTPECKVEQVRGYQAAGDHVLVVGDGINDTAAMGIANASIAVTPVDVFVQTAADATLVNGNLEVVPKILDFAQKTRRIIRQNVGWAIAYNLCAIPFAVTGLLLPWMAALGMSASSLVVVLNANRLFKVE